MNLKRKALLWIIGILCFVLIVALLFFLAGISSVTLVIAFLVGIIPGWKFLNSVKDGETTSTVWFVWMTWDLWYTLLYLRIMFFFLKVIVAAIIGYGTVAFWLSSIVTNLIMGKVEEKLDERDRAKEATISEYSEPVSAYGRDIPHTESIPIEPPPSTAYATETTTGYTASETPSYATGTTTGYASPVTPPPTYYSTSYTEPVHSTTPTVFYCVKCKTNPVSVEGETCLVCRRKAHNLSKPTESTAHSTSAYTTPTDIGESPESDTNPTVFYCVKCKTNPVSVEGETCLVCRRKAHNLSKPTESTAHSTSAYTTPTDIGGSPKSDTNPTVFYCVKCKTNPVSVESETCLVCRRKDYNTPKSTVIYCAKCMTNPVSKEGEICLSCRKQIKNAAYGEVCETYKDRKHSIFYCAKCHNNPVANEGEICASCIPSDKKNQSQKR